MGTSLFQHLLWNVCERKSIWQADYWSFHHWINIAGRSVWAGKWSICLIPYLPWRGDKHAPDQWRCYSTKNHLAVALGVWRLIPTSYGLRFWIQFIVITVPNWFLIAKIPARPPLMVKSCCAETWKLVVEWRLLNPLIQCRTQLACFSSFSAQKGGEKTGFWPDWSALMCRRTQRCDEPDDFFKIGIKMEVAPSLFTWPFDMCLWLAIPMRQASGKRGRGKFAHGFGFFYGPRFG